MGDELRGTGLVRPTVPGSVARVLRDEFEAAGRELEAASDDDETHAAASKRLWIRGLAARIAASTNSAAEGRAFLAAVGVV